MPYTYDHYNPLPFFLRPIHGLVSGSYTRPFSGLNGTLSSQLHIDESALQTKLTNATELNIKRYLFLHIMLAGQSKYGPKYLDCTESITAVFKLHVINIVKHETFCHQRGSNHRPPISQVWRSNDWAKGTSLRCILVQLIQVPYTYDHYNPLPFFLRPIHGLVSGSYTRPFSGLNGTLSSQLHIDESALQTKLTNATELNIKRYLFLHIMLAGQSKYGPKYLDCTESIRASKLQLKMLILNPALIELVVC